MRSVAGSSGPIDVTAMCAPHSLPQRVSPAPAKGRACAPAERHLAGDGYRPGFQLRRSAPWQLRVCADGAGRTPGRERLGWRGLPRSEARPAGTGCGLGLAQRGVLRQGLASLHGSGKQGLGLAGELGAAAVDDAAEALGYVAGNDGEDIGEARVAACLVLGDGVDALDAGQVRALVGSEGAACLPEIGGQQDLGASTHRRQQGGRRRCGQHCQQAAAAPALADLMDAAAGIQTLGTDPGILFRASRCGTVLAP